MQRIPAHVPLRALRKIRGLTAAELAGRIADHGVTVDEDHIYAVELGHKNAGFDLRLAWAAELGVGPRDIRFGDEMRELIEGGVGANEAASAKRRAA